MTCNKCGAELCPQCDGKGWIDDYSDGGTLCCPSCDCEEHLCSAILETVTPEDKTIEKQTREVEKEANNG